jgi:hypothetical protein
MAGVTSTRVGPDAFLVHGDRDPASAVNEHAVDAVAAQVLSARRAGEGVVLVLAGGGDPGATGRAVAAAVAAIAEVGCPAVRLAMSGAGARGADQSIAERLARAYGIEVIAPDGAVVLTADGMMFVRGARRTDGGERAGQWVSRRPDGAAVRYGPRHPAPDWQEALLAVGDGPYGRIVQIPAGVLLTGAADRIPDDLEAALATGCEPRKITVLSAAGDAGQVGRFVRSLPADLADRVHTPHAAQKADGADGADGADKKNAANTADAAKTLRNVRATEPESESQVVSCEPYENALLRPDAACEGAHRDRFTAMFGARYNVHVRAVAAAMAQVPSLRSADPPAARAELAAVRAYLYESASSGLSAAALDDALRASAATGREAPADLFAYGACLTAGLRRLPTYLGSVFVRADISPHMLAVYTPGRSLIEPAAVSASLFHGSMRHGGYLIWSVTGRRTALLADDGSDRLGEVRFPPGSGFLVVAVHSTSEVPAPVVVLYEQSAQFDRAAPVRAAPDRAVHDRLLRLVDDRGALNTEAEVREQSEPAAGPTVPPIGLWETRG